MCGRSPRRPCSAATDTPQTSLTLRCMLFYAISIFSFLIIFVLSNVKLERSDKPIRNVVNSDVVPRFYSGSVYCKAAMSMLSCNVVAQYTAVETHGCCTHSTLSHLDPLICLHIIYGHCNLLGFQDKTVHSLVWTGCRGNADRDHPQRRLVC